MATKYQTINQSNNDNNNKYLWWMRFPQGLSWPNFHTKFWALCLNSKFLSNNIGCSKYSLFGRASKLQMSTSKHQHELGHHIFVFVQQANTRKPTCTYKQTHIFKRLGARRKFSGYKALGVAGVYWLFNKQQTTHNNHILTMKLANTNKNKDNQRQQ